MISAANDLSMQRAAMVAADFNFANCGAVTTLPPFLTALNATYTRPSVMNVLQGTSLVQLSSDQFGTHRDGVPVAYSEKNKLRFTQEFDNAFHTKTNLTVTANAANDSDGNATADKLCESSTSNVQHYLGSYTHLGIGVLQTFSIEARAAERTQVVIQLGSTGTFFNLSTGAVISGTGGTITALGGGLYRCSVTGIPTNANLYVFTAVSGSATYAGTVGYGLYVSKAQLEFGNLSAYESNYDGATGKYGALIEGAATNILTYSEQFDNAVWSKVQSSITANAAVAPDGNTTADKLIPNTALSQHRVDLTSTSTAATYTFSVFIKTAGYNYAFIRIGATAGVVVNLTNGATVLTGAASNPLAESYGNGWYRCSFSCTAGVNDTVRINVEEASNSTDFTGDGTSGIYIWGAQLETGNIATSYILTTSSTATRAAAKLLVPLWKNNLKYSTDPTGTGWSRTNVTLTTGQSDSSGGTTAVKVEATTTAATNLVQNTITAPAGVVTYSIKVKAGTGPTSLFFLLRNQGTSTNFQLGTFTTATGAISGTGWTSTADSNGYYKLTFTQSTGISVGDNLFCYVGWTGGSVTAGHNFYYESPQLESGATATTYVPTTSTLDVTGNATIPGFKSGDLLSVPVYKNVLKYSGDLTNAYWVQTGLSSLVGGQSDPDSGSNAFLLTENSSTSNHFVVPQAATTGAIMRMRVKAKSNGRHLFMEIGGTAYGSINLTTGAVISSTGCTITTTSLGSGWWLCDFLTSSASTSTGAYFALSTAAGNTNYAGGGASGIYLYRPQLSVSSEVQTYVETTSTLDVTDNAINAGFSSAGYTLAADWRSAAARAAGAFLCDLSDNNSSNRVYLAVSFSDASNMQVTTGSASQASIALGGMLSSRRKMAFSCQVNNFVGAVGGLALTADTSGTMPTGLKVLNIGSAQGGTTQFNGPIFRLQLIPKALSQAQVNGWST